MTSVITTPGKDHMTNDRPTERLATRRRCVECGRVFDLTDDTDAAEWTYGHDCEVGA